MTSEKEKMPNAQILDALFAVIQSRKQAGVTQSYSASLLAGAPELPARKLSEETTEVIIEALKSDKDALCRESADLLYHLLVVWAAAGLQPDAVWQELYSRQNQSGLAEKAARQKS
jgi:phosphoribosyl-ATP pyrophosphohydrolase